MYVFFLPGLIWWLVDEKLKANSFCKFHLKQTLVLFIISIGLMIVNAIFGAFLFIPIVGWIIWRIWSIIAILLWIGFFILWMIGLIGAINGQQKEIPIVGKYAKKFKF